jgi:hypothetical protein
MLTPKIAATGISVSCGSWWRESNVPNAAAGKRLRAGLGPDGQRPGPPGQPAAHHLARLTSEIISEVAEH